MTLPRRARMRAAAEGAAPAGRNEHFAAGAVTTPGVVSSRDLVKGQRVRVTEGPEGFPPHTTPGHAVVNGPRHWTGTVRSVNQHAVHLEVESMKVAGLHRDGTILGDRETEVFGTHRARHKDITHVTPLGDPQ